MRANSELLDSVVSLAAHIRQDNNLVTETFQEHILSAEAPILAVENSTIIPLQTALQRNF